ncbi:MAG: hypothetical protein IK095_07520 [Oscillospiraceae bacterium]|nr:hypothetical protein [Oscillospiraceae bacterium]
MKKLTVIMVLALLCGLLLPACAEIPPLPQVTVAPAEEGAGADAEAPASEPEPTAAPTPEPTPEPTKPPFLGFPDGSIHGYGETELDLSWIEHEDVERIAELLRQMPDLQTVELGADNARSAAVRAAQEAAAAESEDAGAEENLPAPAATEAPPEEGETGEPEPVPERLSWADVRLLMEAAPRAEFYYRFRFCGKDFCLQDEEMDLDHRKMDDNGDAVRAILPCMRHLRYLDMDFCEVPDEVMAQIREDYPQVEVVWRIWFGRDDKLSVRTDVERIIASDGGFHVEMHSEPLQYCTKVKLLDMGHQPELHDWSFLGCMPDLEVAVIAIGGFDGDGLACLENCHNMEYLEMCSRSVYDHPLDLSFLSGMPHLRHLNICCLGQVTGYEVLEELTELERLWIGLYTDIPADYVEHLREVLPDTKINVDSDSGVGGGWRWYNQSKGWPDPRYELLCQQFDYGNFDKNCALYWNDPQYWDRNYD